MQWVGILSIGSLCKQNAILYLHLTHAEVYKHLVVGEYVIGI